jgi:cytoskeletal protein CcmA (bactofilin family)
VVVDGNVEGPIKGGDVLLKSQANVVGDIHHESLAIEKGDDRRLRTLTGSRTT